MAIPNSAAQRRAIKADIFLAKKILPTEQAVKAVKFTWEAMEIVYDNILDNRERDRGYVAKAPRGKYKPFIQFHQLRRLQLLTTIRAFQRGNEKNPLFIRAPFYDLQCLLLEVITSTLDHDYYWAIVFLTQVLGDWTASETIDLYHKIMGDRVDMIKLASAVSRTKNQIAEVLNDRFPGRLKHAEDTDKRFIREYATDDQIHFIKDWLQLLFPSNETVAIGPQATNKHAGAEETGFMTIEQIFRLDELSHVAKKIKPSPLEKSLMLPLFVDHDPDRDPNSGPSTTSRDTSLSEVDEILQAVTEARSKRARVEPKFLSVLVNGEEYADIDLTQKTVGFQIPRGASIMHLAATDADGERVLLATYFLSSGFSAADELWEVNVPHVGKVACALSYRENGEVDAELTLNKGAALSPSNKVAKKKDMMKHTHVPLKNVSPKGVDPC